MGASFDSKIDEGVAKHRDYLRALQAALNTVIIEYQRELDSDSTASVLTTPHLSVWAKSEFFCGNADTSAALHLSAARMHMIAAAHGDFLSGPAADAVEQLKEAKETIKTALAAIDAYLTAETESHAAAKVALEALQKLKAKSEETRKEEDEAKQAKLEKEEEKLEKEQDAVQEKADDAAATVKETKAEALKEGKSAVAAAASGMVVNSSCIPAGRKQLSVVMVNSAMLGAVLVGALLLEVGGDRDHRAFVSCGEALARRVVALDVEG